MAGASRSRAPDSTKYVEYEEYVDFQLEKTRAIVKRTDILMTLMALAVGVIGYLLAFVVFDQWIIEGGFGYASRVALLIVVVLAVVGILSWRVVWPLLRHVHPLYAARVIEQSDPKLKSNLVNFVDVKLANAESAPVVLKSMQKRAAVELSHIDVEEAVDHRPLLRIAYVLLGVVIVSALYVALSPKDVFTSVRRALLPTSPLAVATKTMITDVEPGDKDVPARTRQLISAEVHGEEADLAQILFTTADHKYVDEPVKMRRETPGLSKFIGELNGENGKGLLQSLTYRIVAGDARSTDFAIHVIQPPSARVDEVHYVFPKYTELTEKTASGGDIDGWEGTNVTVKATANMKVAAAQILLTDSDDKTEKGEDISMQVTDGTQLSATWKLEFRSDGTAPRYYHIRVRTENQKKDEIDSDPTQYTLRIRADRGPDVVVLDPTGDLTKPANAIIPLVVQAADPDFKVRSVILRGTRGGDSLFNQDVKLFDDELPAKSVTGKYNFKLEPLGLKPGERIQFWIEAKDNKHPTANRTNTTPINVTIDKPVSPEEVQKELARDEKNQQEQLDRANDANNSNKLDEEQTEPRAGDRREDVAQYRKDRPDPGAAQPKNDVADEPRSDQEDVAERKGGKDSPDQPGKPFDNNEALRKLLKKQPSPDSADQNPDEKQTEQQEPQDATEENPPDRSQQKQGEEGSGKEGRGRSKNQQQKSSDQSSSDRGQQGENTSDGNRQGNQPQPGDENSNNDAGENSKNSNKKKTQAKSQPTPGIETDEPGAEPGDRPKNGQKSNKSADGEENAAGDKQKPAGKPGDKKTGEKAGEKKSSDKKDGKNQGGSDPNSDKDDQPKRNGTKDDPAGNEDEQTNPDQAGKDKSDKSKPAGKDAGSEGGEGDEEKTGDQSDSKKPGAKEGGSGNENQSADGDKDSQQKNKQQGGAPKKPADKSDAGGGEKDDQQTGGTPGKSDKDQVGDQSDDNGQGDNGQSADQSPNDANGPKKSAGDSDPKGRQKPAVDDGTAKDKPATGNETGDAEGDDRPGDRDLSQAGENVKKKDGTKPGANKPGKPNDPQGQKANQKRAADEGAEGGTDDAEDADRAPDGKKATEQPGKLDEPPSEKGVERRKEGSEIRPGKPPEGGNEKMRGQGRKDGQKSDQPQTGEQGSSAASDQGTPGANKDGPGDKTDEAGNTDPAGKKTGQPGSKKKGTGTATKPSDDGEGQEQDASGDNPGDKGAAKKGQKSKSGKPGQGDEPGESADGQKSGQSGGNQSGKPGGKPSADGDSKESGNEAGGQPGSGQSSPGGKPGNSGPQKSGGGASSVPGGGNQAEGGDAPDAQPDETPRDRTEPTAAEEEAADLENAKKATNLVLKRLKSQLERGEVDQEMLDELGWKGKQDVEKFVRYLEDNLNQNADDNSPEAQARRLQFEETLRTLEVGSETQRRSGSVGKERAIEQIGSKNVPPPREYQKIWESYTRSLSKTNEKKPGEKNEAKVKPTDKAKANQGKKAGSK